MKFRHQPRGIVHVGACDLEEADYYKSLGDPHVIWVESRDMFKSASWNHTILKATFSDRAEIATFHVTNNLYSSSLLPVLHHPGVTEVGQITVWTVRADECFEQLSAFSVEHYDTLVVDVQGAELKVLRGFGKLLDGFDWIISEVFYAELYENVPESAEVVNYLKNYGFKLVEEEKNESGLWGDMMFERVK